MFLARRYKPSADEHGRARNAVHTNATDTRYAHMITMYSGHSKSREWTRLLLLIFGPQQSLKATAISPQSAHNAILANAATTFPTQEEKSLSQRSRRVPLALLQFLLLTH